MEERHTKMGKGHNLSKIKICLKEQWSSKDLRWGRDTRWEEAGLLKNSPACLSSTGDPLGTQIKDMGNCNTSPYISGSCEWVPHAKLRSHTSCSFVSENSIYHQLLAARNGNVQQRAAHLCQSLLTPSPIQRQLTDSSLCSLAWDTLSSPWRESCTVLQRGYRGMEEKPQQKYLAETRQWHPCRAHSCRGHVPVRAKVFRALTDICPTVRL